VNTTARDLPVGTRIEVQIERLGDGSISFKAVNHSTSRVLVDTAYVARGGLQEITLRVLPEGIVYSAS
jgi:hypothetical protein